MASTGGRVGDVYDALENVVDPELGLNFVELGLIYDVEVDDGHAHVEYSLTTPACPAAGSIEGWIVDAVYGVEGIESVRAELVWSPPWSPEMMNEDARFAFGY